MNGKGQRNPSRLRRQEGVKKLSWMAMLARF